MTPRGTLQSYQEKQSFVEDNIIQDQKKIHIMELQKRKTVW